MKRYSEEFRDESVRLVLESERSVAEIARELGISVWTLRGWMKKCWEQTRQGVAPRRETVEEAVRRLPREVSVLRQEREILKEAAAYFAKEQL